MEMQLRLDPAQGGRRSFPTPGALRPVTLGTCPKSGSSTVGCSRDADGLGEQWNRKAASLPVVLPRNRPATPGAEESTCQASALPAESRGPYPTGKILSTKERQEVIKLKQVFGLLP